VLLPLHWVPPTLCIALAEQSAQNAEAVDDWVSGSEQFGTTAWFQILLDKDIGAMMQGLEGFILFFAWA
jgi:hypothetical protein